MDPEYALAHFNLGNLYDEQATLPLALHHYNQAIRLRPNYADAHYNLALLHQALAGCDGSGAALADVFKAGSNQHVGANGETRIEETGSHDGSSGEDRPLSSKLHLLKSEKA